MHKHATAELIQQYNATNGAEVTSIVFNTSKAYCVKFELWDTAGCEKLGKLRDCYYVGADCAVLMYDVTSASEYR